MSRSHRSYLEAWKTLNFIFGIQGEISREKPEFVMSIYLRHINFCMRNYGINGVSERVASKHINVASCGHGRVSFLQAARWSRHAVIFVFFYRKNGLELFREIALKSLE